MVRLGIDFGASATVIARSGKKEGSGAEVVLPFPNLIHLTQEGTLITGNDVITGGFLHAPSTARHLRHYILRNSPVLIRAGSHAVPYRDAAREFLVTLIRNAAAAGDGPADDAVFSVPAGAPEHYTEWLASVADAAGLPSVHMIDEVTAAAAGYGLQSDGGEIIMLFDAGAGATGVTVACHGPVATGASAGSRIIGSAVSDTGGQAIDGWLASEVLQRSSPVWGAPDHADRSLLLEACRAAKEDLSSAREADIPAAGRGAGAKRVITITREEFERVLQQHGLSGTIGRTVDRALAAAQLKGYEKDRISRVLMTGGTSLVPAVQDIVRRLFDTGRVLCDNPQTAIARGAACYVPGTGNRSRITRDYALRYYDPASCTHQYRYIVRRGTDYPTAREAARLLISAAYDGQTRLGIALFAIGGCGEGGMQQGIELVADPLGATRCVEHPDEPQAQDSVWVNRLTPTFLVATPPGKKGEVRFELAFSIDSTGQLRLSARDVMTGLYVLENHSCAQLS